MINIEIRGFLNQYIKAVLRDLLDDVAVVYHPEINKEERIPLSEVRLPPPPGKEIESNQFAEVLFSISSSQSNVHTGRWGDDSNEKCDVQVILDEYSEYLSIPSWWPCRVHGVRDEVAVVKLNVLPPDGSNSDSGICAQLSTVTDIVSRKIVRQPSGDAPHLTADMIFKHKIEIPKELAEFASDPSVHNDFLNHCGSPTSHYYDAETSTLIILSTNLSTVQNVALLEETHLRMLRQKWAITRSMLQTMRTLEISRGGEHGRSNMAGARTSGDWNTDQNLFVEKFYVPQSLMGLAIGAHGVNIRAARDIPDVVHISSRDPIDHPRNGEPGQDSGDHSDSVLFTVEAKTQKAAEQARAMLEFTELYLGVPHRYVGRLIGRRTANISSIIEKSGVVHIHFDDNIEENSLDYDHNPNENPTYNYGNQAVPPSGVQRIFLKAGGVQASSQPHADEKYGGFILAGTREAVEKARLLINFQMDYIYELEKMETEKRELMRNLSRGVSDSGPRGSNRGWGERGGSGGGAAMGRGGRPRRAGRGSLLPAPGTDGGGRGGRAMPSYFSDNENGGGAPFYQGSRRPPRDSRMSRSSMGRSMRQGGGPRRPNQWDSEWRKHTGSNGDVVDRRRGSEDSDAMGSNLSHENLSDDRQMIGRPYQSNRTPAATNGYYSSNKERGVKAGSSGQDDEFSPRGDTSSPDEGDVAAHSTPRTRAAMHNRDNPRLHRSSRPRQNSRAGQWSSNGQSNRPHTDTSDEPVKPHGGVLNAKQPTQV